MAEADVVEQVARGHQARRHQAHRSLLLLHRPNQPNLLYGPSISLLLPRPNHALSTLLPSSTTLAGRRLPHRTGRRSAPYSALLFRRSKPRGGEEAAPRKMGWKAAEKLIRHWKILRAAVTT